MRRRGRLAGFLGVLLAVVAAALGSASAASADRPFNVRFTANATGDITLIGNTLETCTPLAADCANARAGRGSPLNNNDFTMEHVNVAGGPGRFDSSSARLSLPAGAQVLFAGLYYGSRLTAGTHGKAAPDGSQAAIATVDFKPPDDARFQQLTAQVDDSSEVKGAYGAFADVTNLVRRAGSGEYLVANVQSATGEDRYAGWALAVAYEAAGEPPRNLTVFDGLRSITQGQSATIPVSGFQTSLSGPVRTRLGFVAYEGDLGGSGDGATLEGRALTDATTPAKNFFNSAISIDGRPFADKSPDYVNQLGFDAKQIRIDGLLANGATRAEIGLKTSSDQYLPQALTFATDLYAPIIHATKTVANLTHPHEPARPGDRLRYTVSYSNEGRERADDFVARDVLPRHTTYVPGSLEVPGETGNDARPSDLPGDDVGEYDPGAREVRFSLGAAAGAGGGGSIAPAGQTGDRATISFDAEVDRNTEGDRRITDVAQAEFRAPTLGGRVSVVSNAATIDVKPEESSALPADLASAQTETVAPANGVGSMVDDHILVENRGPGPSTDILVRDRLPPGATVESATTDGVGCSISVAEVMCTIAHLVDGGAAEVNVVERVPAADVSTGSANEASVQARQLDPDPANNDQRTTAIEPPVTGGRPASADLDVHTRQSPEDLRLGGQLTETIAVHDTGPGDATGVDVTGVLSDGAQVLGISPGAAACALALPLRCRLSDLRAGTTETIRLKLRPLLPGAVIDAVTVSGNQPDPSYANNAAEASTHVRARRTQVSLHVISLQRVAARGQRVGVVLRVAVRVATTGLGSVLCATLPGQLRAVSASDAIRHGSLLCWDIGEIDPARAQSLRIDGRVGAHVRPGTLLTVRARLRGTNFAARSARALIQVPPRFTACPALAGRRPVARAAC